MFPNYITFCLKMVYGVLWQPQDNTSNNCCQDCMIHACGLKVSKCAMGCDKNYLGVSK